MNVYACICVCVYVCIRKRRYLYISYILYICDILVLHKFSIIINPASWLQHANKEYYYYRLEITDIKHINYNNLMEIIAIVMCDRRHFLFALLSLHWTSLRANDCHHH